MLYVAIACTYMSLCHDVHTAKTHFSIIDVVMSLVLTRLEWVSFEQLVRYCQLHVYNTCLRTHHNDDSQCSNPHHLIQSPACSALSYIVPCFLPLTMCWFIFIVRTQENKLVQWQSVSETKQNT